MINAGCSGMEWAYAELETAYAHGIPGTIYGRLLLRPEIVPDCSGMEWAYAELE